jgi:CubicO group peptidase (beta-lactamase class C family)
VPRYFPGAAALAVVLAAAIVALALSYAYRVAAIGTAYAAKVLCSGVFVSQRDAAAVFDNDIAMDDLAFLRRLEVRVDRDARKTTASLFGIAGRSALYREGLGCAVAHGTVTPMAAKAAARPAETLVTQLEPRFDAVLDWAFAEPDPAAPRRTRAVVVLHGGRVVAERYAPGFTRETPLPGWSMAKSVTGALVGTLVRAGRIGLQAPAPLPEWQKPDDPRKGITFEHLLHMSSGLRFDEDYGDPLSDVMRMLLAEPSAGAFAAQKPLEHTPGTHWSYASGTTNVITHALRRAIGDAEYSGYPRGALFDRIGMTGAVMEADASGAFVGSSFMYATARDWARFGLLYLRDGVWAGERLLPEGWVRFSVTPAPVAPGGIYGAHFWLRLHSGASCGTGAAPPADAFHASGHEGQHLTIIPSRDVVIVRLGLTRHPCAWDQAEFIRRVLDANRELPDIGYFL